MVVFFLPSRRDGSSFLNLLMISPLCCDQGLVRYWIGAQMDVSRLLTSGLESFSNLKELDRLSTRYGGAPPKTDRRAAAAQLRSLLSSDDFKDTADPIATQHHYPNDGRQRRGNTQSSHVDMHRAPRRYVGMNPMPKADLWPTEHEGKSGRLPGIFQNVCYRTTRCASMHEAITRGSSKFPS